MTTSRRSFLQTSAISAGALAAGAGTAILAGLPRAALARPRPTASGAPLKILILGGTGFVGPACTEAALARGHKVTLFNRGRMETFRKERSRPSTVPEGVEVLYGNRDPNKTADAWIDDPRTPAAPDGQKREKPAESPKGLSQLEGKKWDAVIDTSAFFPRMAKASAELLSPNIGHYLFISTISVYKRNDQPGADETAELATLSDPTSEEFGAQYENYGGGKVACEQAVEAACPGRAILVRPGFIVGQRDNTRRYSYWPNRVSQGGEMVVPGDPTDPIQIIDVRDLAEWCIHLIENQITGAFNATGPEMQLTMKAFLEGTREGLKTDTSFNWIPLSFLSEQNVPNGAFPLYIPPTGETSGFHNVSVAKAVKNGLKFRPCSETARATMEWVSSLPEDVRKSVLPPTPGEPMGGPGSPMSPHLTKERELEIVKAFKEKK